MNADEFGQELTQLEYRYHIHHPFDKLLQNGLASKKMLQMWAANRYYYQDTIPRKDAAIISVCNDSRVRAIWCRHIITHDVDNALEEWLMLTRALDLQDDDVVSGKFLLPGTKFACDAYYNFCRDVSWQEGICSSMTHLFAGNIHSVRLKNWPERYPWLDPSAFTYFTKRRQTLPEEIDSSINLIKDHFGKTPELIDRAKSILRFKQDVLWSMMDALWMYFQCEECRMPTRKLECTISGPVLRVLGSGAGGGVPQWNKHDSWNEQARHQCALKRSQCSIAVSNDTKQWIVVNCSSDFQHQWNALLKKYPSSSVRAVVLTDNQLDHIGGLISLRESSTPIDIYCTTSVAESLRTDTKFLAILQSYCGVNIHLITNEWTIEGISLTPFILEERTSKFASTKTDVLALKLNHTAIYAPCVSPEALVTNATPLRDFIKEITTVFFDGTFHDDDEMPNVKGHSSMTNTLRFFKTHCLGPPMFLHINNTNTKTDGSVAYDGMECML